MIGGGSKLVQPAAYRIWDADRQLFSFTDQQPEMSDLVDRWTGRFDKQGRALYERDIIHVHYNWKLGWVRALVVPHPERSEFAGQATDPDGTPFLLGFYYFGD